MDKKSFVAAIALSSISIGAIIPIYLLLKKNKELKRELEQRGSTSKKTEPSKVSVEKRSES